MSDDFAPLWMNIALRTTKMNFRYISYECGGDIKCCPKVDPQSIIIDRHQNCSWKDHFRISSEYWECVPLKGILWQWFGFLFISSFCFVNGVLSSWLLMHSFHYYPWHQGTKLWLYSITGEDVKPWAKII